MLRPPARTALLLLSVAVSSLAAVATRAQAQDDDVEPESLGRGLSARFTHASTPTVLAFRTLSDLSCDWTGGSPVARLPAQGFRMEARGYLLVQAPGPHTFHAAAGGRLTLRLHGKTVIDGGPDSFRSGPVELRAGFVPVEVVYEDGAGEGRLALDWEGPGFSREPVPARLLYHDPRTAAKPDLFEEGRRLADRFGCANCHALLDLPRHRTLGPPLDGVVSTMEPGWLGAWLHDPTRVRARTRMPAFGPGLSPQESADLIAFLRKAGPKRPEPSAEVRMGLNVATPEKGRLLFRSLGCLGCHESPGLPSAVAAGPDLTGLGRKRTPAALAAYLEHPKSRKAQSRHRPDLRLTADESAYLAAYLATAPEGEKPDLAQSLPEGDAARGGALADRLKCAACHDVPGLKSPAQAVALKPGARPDAGCLAEGPGSVGVPRFALDPAEREALRVFVAALPSHPSPTPLETRGTDTIRRRNCLGCHARDAQGGEALAARLAALLAEDPALGGLKGTLTPPNLSAVGDKLRPDYLAKAVRAEAPQARPWLSVRMPSFPFEPGEDAGIVDALRRHDASLAETPAASTPVADRKAAEVGAQLVGQKGFGCLSCHVLEGRIPPGGEPETLGPDLSLAHARMTERYFKRWLSDPQRIIAGTPMPQFVKPVSTPGAPASLEGQLRAVWGLLGSPALPEVAAAGTREVLRREGPRALVVRDMMLVPGAPGTQYTPRGIAFGFENDCSLLFDADRLTWLAAWRGGFAYRTKSGRLWEWHPDGRPVWTTPRRLAPLAFLGSDGRLAWPEEVRERFGSFRSLDFEGNGVRLSYRLNRAGSTPCEVTESVRPAGRGWERLVKVEGLPDGVRTLLVEPLPADARPGSGPGTWQWSAGPDRLTLAVQGAEPWTKPDDLKDVPARFWLMPAAGAGLAEARVTVSVETK
ncbi:MAG: c-type cytochrome [Isosphaeraceae bacterium]